MPGSPVFHGTATSTAPQGLGGAARVTSPTAVKPTNDLAFFAWVAIIGILIPVLIIGGLKVGGFQFVFKHR
jgi:hypothetical protein